MHLADHPLGQGQLCQESLGLAHCRTVVQYFADVLAALGGNVLPARLELQHLAHRGLGTFDTRREHRFLGGQRREQDVRVRHGGQHAIITGDCRGRRTDQRDKPRPVQLPRGEPALVVMDRSHYTPSVSNIRRKKSSSIRRTFQVSSGALRFSRLLSPFT